MSAKMNTFRMTAIIVGVLYITATVACSLSLILSKPILDASDYLSKVSANETQVIISALLMLIDALAVAGIAITLYPVLKKHNETLALGYVGARIMEGILFIVYVIILLTLLTLGQEFVQGGALDASCFEAGGTLLLAASDWTFSLGYGIIFTLSALILNYMLYQSKLIPRWLSIWGIVGATLSFALTLLGFFNISLTELLDLPIAVQEMVFAVWLIVKGFNPDVTPSKTT